MFGHLSVKARLVAIGALASLIFVATCGLAISRFSAMTAKSNQAAAAQSVRDVASDASINWTLDDDQSNMYGAVIALKDPTQQQLAETTWGQAVSAYDQAAADVKQLRVIAVTPAESKLVDQISADLDSYNGFSQKERKAALAGDITGAVRAVTVDNLEPSNDLPVAFANLQKLEDGRVRAAQTSLTALANGGTTLLIIVAAVGLVLMIASTLLIARSVIRPLRQVGHRLDDIAEGEGDLTQEVEVARRDELGAVADAFNRFTHKLRRLIGSVGTQAESLSTSSTQLTAVSQEMSSSATHVAAQAKVAATASDEVAENVQMVASATEEMHASLAEISRSTAEAESVVSEAVVVSGQTTETVASLVEAASRIEDTIRLVSGIAAQTTILALNATIEAARAGEAGHGFAVVAQEVRQLAHQTSEATREISTMVRSVQNDTDAVAQGMSTVSGLVADVSSTHHTIAAAVEEQTIATSEIASNVAQIADRSAMIAAIIAEMAQVTARASEGAAETEESAHALAGMASDLTRLVGQFRY